VIVLESGVDGLFVLVSPQEEATRFLFLSTLVELPIQVRSRLDRGQQQGWFVAGTPYRG
jgi:hypothetical protein